jgi:quinohemoprotein ethanol dehydrogenase
VFDKRRLKALAASLAACAVAVTGMGASKGPPSVAPSSVDWPNHGGPVDESGFTPLTQINRANVKGLGLAWSLDLPGEVSLEATPIEVGGVLYFSGAYSAVYAVDAVSGKLLWKYDPQMWKRNSPKLRAMYPINRGVAYADGRVFVCTLDGHLIAIDAKTGQALWDVDTLPAATSYFSTGAPRVFRGKVIIGNGGGDEGMRGFATAYDQKTGKLIWRFYMAPGSPEENAGDPAMDVAAKTWSGTQWWKVGTGGGPWNGITFDPELNQIYLGAGNSGPYNPRVRSPGGGDTLFLTSVVAVDADTGQYKWHYQYNPREAWDYKATSNIITATLTIDGKPRKVMMQAPTNGFFYVIDRETGKLISAEKITKATWADSIDLTTGRPVERPNIRYENGHTVIYPGPTGGHNWQAMSFDPKTGLVYVPAVQVGGEYSLNNEAELDLGGMTIQAYLDPNDPHDGKGSLLAWDPATHKERWRVWLPDWWNTGILSTGGDLLFIGNPRGQFDAYDAVNGQRLWRFETGLGLMATPMSYSVNGKQYVSVLVGWGGSAAAGSKLLNYGWRYGAQPRRLLTFALGGTKTLPPSKPADTAVHAVDDPSLKLDPAQVEEGRKLSVNCVVCHGPGFRNPAGPAPDLRESQLALSADGVYAVVHDGALRPKGMPMFDQFTRAQTDALHAYIRQTARDALAGKQGDKATKEVF